MPIKWRRVRISSIQWDETINWGGTDCEKRCLVMRMLPSCKGEKSNIGMLSKVIVPHYHFPSGFGVLTRDLNLAILVPKFESQWTLFLELLRCLFLGIVHNAVFDRCKLLIWGCGSDIALDSDLVTYHELFGHQTSLDSSICLGSRRCHVILHYPTCVSLCLAKGHWEPVFWSDVRGLDWFNSFGLCQSLYPHSAMIIWTLQSVDFQMRLLPITKPASPTWYRVGEGRLRPYTMTTRSYIKHEGMCCGWCPFFQVANWVLPHPTGWHLVRLSASQVVEASIDSHPMDQLGVRKFIHHIGECLIGIVISAGKSGFVSGQPTRQFPSCHDPIAFLMLGIAHPYTASKRCLFRRLMLICSNSPKPYQEYTFSQRICLGGLLPCLQFLAPWYTLHHLFTQ